MIVRQSPLDADHRRLGAKLVPFGGWEMPLSYPSGTLAEHRACREGVVVFDVSHLGTVRVTGTDAHAVLQRAFTNDLDRIGPGRAQYTHLLDPADGSVRDDIIVWWRGPGLYDVMPNASNTDGVTGALSEVAASLDLGDLVVTDVTAERAVLALQGPDARRVAGRVAPALAAVGRFDVADVEVDGVTWVVAGTGYTGEDGLEFAIPVDAASSALDRLCAEGALPAGLGARDTLRLEAGLPLHGQELGPGITPLQAGLGWVVRWDKGDFRGRDALEAERDAGPRRSLVGLRTDDRRPPRHDDVVERDGIEVGTVTSGNFSPVLGVGIALGFVDGGAAEGEVLAIRSRGATRPATVVGLPFVGR